MGCPLNNNKEMIMSFNGICFIAFIIIMLIICTIGVVCMYRCEVKHGVVYTNYTTPNGTHVYVYECKHSVCMNRHMARMAYNHVSDEDVLVCMHPHMHTDM